jgi:hypothetical protein
MIAPSHSAVQHASAIRRKKIGLLAACLSWQLLGCEPELIVGRWECRASDGDERVPRTTEPVVTPWSTGFENAFCDYGAPAGYCYAIEPATYDIVTSPVHSGSRAAAFRLSSNGALGQMQTRCVRQGELPVAAYYSAFFFIPAAPSAASNWNLMHFRSGDGGPTHGIWDVSLQRQPDGSFEVYAFDFLRRLTRTASGVPPVPIGVWFQLEVYLRRAADDTGEFAVYQDGQLALALDGLSTDDASYGQWYTGNLAASLTPAESVLYVDDVSVSLVRQ